MSNPAQILLGRYHYTALDKLAACTQGAQPSTQRFYLKERLSTEIQGTVRHSVMQHEEQLLAQQQQQAGTLHTQLLATDQQRSVLALLDGTRPQQLAYSPYGHHVPENGLLGFNGERPDPLTGWYLLGNGYRAFDPVLMRFICPDNSSPFDEGGINAYGYCAGDPVNRVDPTGHANIFMRILGRIGKAFGGGKSAPKGKGVSTPSGKNAASSGASTSGKNKVQFSNTNGDLHDPRPLANPKQKLSNPGPNTTVPRDELPYPWNTSTGNNSRFSDEYLSNQIIKNMNEVTLNKKNLRHVKKTYRNSDIPFDENVKITRKLTRNKIKELREENQKLHRYYLQRR